MDILWAISHPPVAVPGEKHVFPGAPPSVVTGTFAVPTPLYADGSWDMYEDFVGGVQFWSHGLVSGSGDGAVRMWDSEFVLQIALAAFRTHRFINKCVRDSPFVRCRATQHP